MNGVLSDLIKSSGLVLNGSSVDGFLEMLFFVAFAVIDANYPFDI